MRTMIALMVLALGGCANAGKQLYVAHDTKLGIDASVNTATTSGSIDLGYDRRFLTWVPRSVSMESDPQSKDVMSVLACSLLRVNLLEILYYDESIATGKAAAQFAEALEDEPTTKEYFACFVKPKNEQGD